MPFFRAMIVKKLRGPGGSSTSLSDHPKHYATATRALCSVWLRLGD